MKILAIFALTLCLSGGVSQAQPAGDTRQAVSEVMKIAHAISVVQPNLPEPKYVEYALAIYRASKRYDIRPVTLIAIAQQETSFREDLPEGPAGEIGITQILKSWLKNPAFIREFGKATIADLRTPAKSFLYSAWLLRTLKDNEKPGALPYWSYYNARKFKHRLKYFAHVNRHLRKLRKRLPLVIAQREARLAQAGKLERMPASTTTEAARSAGTVAAGLVAAAPKAQATPSESRRQPLRPVSKTALLETASLLPGT